MADPSPPVIEADDLSEPGEARRLVEEMRDLSERELMDQVYRRVTIYLCRRCYASWIEDPAGWGAGE